jgi:hypothetical protein
MASSRKPPKGVVTPFGAASSTIGQHALVGSKVKGSSLPNRSGMPNSWNLAARAFVRWQASKIMSSVDEVLTAVVVDDVDVELEVDVDVELEVDDIVGDDLDVEVDVDVVDVVRHPSHAEAGGPATATAAAATAPAITSLSGLYSCFIVSS